MISHRTAHQHAVARAYSIHAEPQCAPAQTDAGGREIHAARLAAPHDLGVARGDIDIAFERGATPRYLSLNVILEEGMEIAQLERIVQSMRRAALESDVYIATGDTKVVRRGEASGMYLATSGIGLRRRALRLGMDRIRAGDSVLVSGPVGDHGAAVLLAREEFGLRGDLRSDAASVLPLTRA